MKRIFTLLFCVGALAFASSATTPVEECIQLVLNGESPVPAFKAPNMDVNHDGVINITDITTMICEKMKNEEMMRAKGIDPNDETKGETEPMFGRIQDLKVKKSDKVSQELKKKK